MQSWSKRNSRCTRPIKRAKLGCSQPGLYRDRIVVKAGGLKFRDKLVLLDTFAVPSLLATPL